MFCSKTNWLNDLLSSDIGLVLYKSIYERLPIDLSVVTFADPDILIVWIISEQIVRGKSVLSTMHSCLLIIRLDVVLFSIFLANVIRSVLSPDSDCALECTWENQKEGELEKLLLIFQDCHIIIYLRISGSIDAISLSVVLFPLQAYDTT